MKNNSETREAKQLLSLIEEAVSPFHAVQAVKEQLNKAGFEELSMAVNTMSAVMAHR